MAFKHYLEEEDDKPYFTTNSLGYYYDKMEGFAEKVEQAAKILNVTKEEVERNITAYIEQNKNELDQRLAQWDGKLETFDSSVETLLTEWVDDGTLSHVIDSTLIEQKIAPVKTQLAEKAQKSDVRVDTAAKPINVSEMDTETKALFTGGSVAVVGEKSVGVENVKSKAITGDKTTFLEPTRNLFNKYAVTAGKRVASGTGLLVDVAGVNTSEYIPVSSLVSANIRRSHVPEAFVFYDADKVYISGGSSSSSVNPIPIPANAVFIRTSVKDVDLNAFQLEYGDVSTAYISFHSKLSSDIEFEVTAAKTTFLTNTQGKNLFNKELATSESGWLWSAGTLISYAGFKASGLMRVEPGQKITRNYKHSTVFFNDKKAFVSGLSNSDAANTPTITIPAGVYYMAATVENSMVDTYQAEVGEVQTSYEPYKEMYALDKELKMPASIGGTSPAIVEPWSGKRLIVNGDSIAAGWTPGGYETLIPYPSLIATELGMALTNYAIGGCTIAVKEATPTERSPIVTRFNDMAAGDVVIIAAGTNDWWYDWTPLGDMANRSNFTFYGALHNLCLGLLDKYQGKPILFLTPIKRYGDPATVNANGKTLKEYGGIVKEVCDYYSIPVLDMWTVSMLNTHVATQKTLYVPDGTHPNNLGHQIMKRPVKSAVKSFF